MEIIITPAYSTMPLVHIQHKQSVVSLDTQTLMRPNNWASFPELFKYLNWFFNQLPEADQERVFNIYARTEELLRKSDDMVTVDGEIHEIFEDLLEVLNAQRIYDWIRPAAMYPWPSDTELPRSFGNASSPKYPEEKTYILKEYQELIAMIIQLRACVPIWAAYLNKFGSRISGNYRDTTLVNLLTARSNIEDSPAWERLTRYINAWLGTKEENYTAGVIHGVSAEDYPKTLRAQAILRKLCLQALKSVQENDASPFVVKHLANFMRECLIKNPATYETPRVKAANNREDHGNGENERSMYENTNAKESVARGDRWMIQIYLENNVRAIKALEPNIEKDTYQRIFAAFDPATYVPTAEQMLIALWVVSPIVSPRSESDLTRLNSVAICQIAAAVLWHRGHKEIATLMTCEQGAPIMRTGLQSFSVTRLSRETYAKLAEIYPYAANAKNKGNAFLPVREIIIETISNFQSHTWNVKLPPAMASEVSSLFPDGVSPTLRVLQNMQMFLVDVVIDIAQRPLPENAVDKATRIAKEMNLPMQPTPWPVSVPTHRPLMAQ